MTTSINERPMCPVCKHRMALARISPGPRGFEERTFESSTCRAYGSGPLRGGSDADGCGGLARRRTEATAMTFEENLREWG
jgi:hypothetical protein